MNTRVVGVSQLGCGKVDHVRQVAKEYELLGCLELQLQAKYKEGSLHLFTEKKYKQHIPRSLVYELLS